MHMNQYEKRRSTEEILANAIRAVEGQHENRRTNFTEDRKVRRDSFYELLSKHEIQIFSGVAYAVRQGRRDYNPSSISEFSQGCAKIFKTSNMFDSELMNDWLDKRDLRHLFWATDSTIIW